jgi:DMSO/TMAO reductase YedYZ molybdopterin-dependent catalytic subunit
MDLPLDEQPLRDSPGERDSSTVDPPRGVASAPVVVADCTPQIQKMFPAGNLPVDRERPEDALHDRLRKLSRRGFFVGGAAALVGVTGWRWVVTRGEEGELPWPLRRVLELDERLARALFRPSRLSPEFSNSKARMPRVNGFIGLDSNLDLSEWRLKVTGSAGSRSLRSFTLDEIKALPRIEMTTELRCVEGWSEIVHWSGARLSDLATVTGLAKRGGRMLEYAALKTPDGGYYVGLDIASALHPQALLCYEMNGQPLSPEHGAPLRLVIPTKYGIKNLKRIGTIQFSDLRPADYWAERGYDWYAGH